jgi:hypothetical protein
MFTSKLHEVDFAVFVLNVDLGCSLAGFFWLLGLFLVAWLISPARSYQPPFSSLLRVFDILQPNA